MERTEEGLYVYAVLDGHGGSRASEFASHNLIPLVLEAIRPDMTNDQVSFPMPVTSTARHCSRCSLHVVYTCLIGGSSEVIQLPLFRTDHPSCCLLHSHLAVIRSLRP